LSRRDPGNSTVPSASSGLTVSEDAPLAVEWLFPRTDGPVIALGPPLSEVIIGRDEDCGVVLAGSEVSRRHARVRREGPVLLITDLESRNGTRVNGRRIGTVPLESGDVIRIGGWVGVATCTPGPKGSLAQGLYAGPATRAALAPVERAARSDLPILLEGETGTGKEAVARAVHSWSGRAGPFVAVNCGALPEGLAEAELFGYRRGAFTGAIQSSLGQIRSAQGGTLLLDEVCELPFSVQPKLLRVLEQREVQPLGESRPVPIDVRIVAAAQQPLATAVSQGHFRRDLLARLDGVAVRLAPLRERRAEVPYLFSRLLTEQAGGRPPPVEARLVEQLCLYDWPFNVRELLLLVKRLLVLHGSDPILRARTLPGRMLHGGRAEVDVKDSSEIGRDSSSSEPADLSALVEALRASGGNVARAAAALGMSRQRAYRLMQGRPEQYVGPLREGRERG
jgi:two-component system response regulator GlrR